MAAAERRGCIDAQQAARRTIEGCRRQARFIKIRKNSGGPFEENRPSFSEIQPMRRPVKYRSSEAELQGADIARHGRNFCTSSGRCPGKATEFHGTDEGSQRSKI